MRNKLVLNLCLAAALFSSANTGVLAQEGPQAAASSNFKLPPQTPSAEFAFASKFQSVRNSAMHFVEEGTGDSVLFLHGNPSSSYLWRNIIPYLSTTHRAIAVDLIGMGKSDKPSIEYRFADHFAYLEEFIEEMELSNIILVVHDWGAALGFEYARRHPDNVKAIAFMEGVLPPAFPQPSFTAMGEAMGGLFKTLKDPIQGKQFVIENNGFVEQLLPAFVNRNLGETEMATYRQPYLSKESRLPTLVWPQEIPVGGVPAETTTLMRNIDDFMGKTEIPMLLLYANPGAVTPPELVPVLTAKISNLDTAFVGQGLHFIQEDQPEAIGRALADWLRRHNI